MKQTFFLLLTIFLLEETFAQEKAPINIIYDYLNKHDSDLVRLVVENRSNKPYYYSISLGGLIEGECKPLLSDVNSLGQKEFVALTQIKGKSKKVKQVSIKQIFSIYKAKELNKIRFGVMFYEKRDFRSKGNISYTSPI